MVKKFIEHSLYFSWFWIPSNGNKAHVLITTKDIFANHKLAVMGGFPPGSLFTTW